jgi:hypothetical protein
LSINTPKPTKGLDVFQLATTVLVANLKRTVSLLWRKKIVANAQAQKEKEAEEAAQHAATLEPEIEEVHIQPVEEELIQPVNQVSCKMLTLICISTCCVNFDL